MTRKLDIVEPTPNKYVQGCMGSVHTVSMMPNIPQSLHLNGLVKTGKAEGED